jgi:hypothetical protein
MLHVRSRQTPLLSRIDPVSGKSGSFYSLSLTKRRRDQRSAMSYAWPGGDSRSSLVTRPPPATQARFFFDWVETGHRSGRRRYIKRRIPQFEPAAVSGTAARRQSVPASKVTGRTAPQMAGRRSDVPISPQVVTEVDVEYIYFSVT